jgi:ParB family chromosome partitioning protein
MMATDKKRKAYNIDFGAVAAEPVASDTEGHSKKKSETAPGMMVDIMLAESATMIENTALKAEVAEIKKKVVDIESDAAKVVAEFDGASVTRKIDPKFIRRSKWANREEKGLTDEHKDFRELKAEILAAGGNVQAIKVRPIRDTSPQEYEIVFGHRRHKACSDLGLNVLATIEALDDKKLFIEMDRENRQRADLRPYEQGLMYMRALDQGLFDSMRKMAEEIGVKHPNISVAVAIARLPDSILDAFASRLDIQFRWSAPLTDALQKNPDMVLARANEIAIQRKAGEVVASADVFKKLAGLDKVKPVTAIRAVKVGDQEFTVAVKGSEVSYVFDKLERTKHAQLEKLIKEFLAN